MEQLINDLVGRYDTGRMSRRELVGALAVLAVGVESASAAPAAFENPTINHVSVVVSDLKRSADWYQRVFGLPMLNQETNLVRLKVGPTQFLSLRTDTIPKGFDHFALGIDRYNADAVRAELRARGLTPQQGAGAGLHVADPDGLLVQVSANGTA
jgi:catechol 2,3-dioxygenase-like lactoylglutathione lyase family enzyme